MWMEAEYRGYWGMGIRMQSVGLSIQQLQGILNGLGGTVGQEDVLGVAREAIALGDVGGHIVADLAHTGGVGVGTRATGVSNQQLLSSLDGIGVEHLGMLLSDLRPGGDATAPLSRR